MNEDMYDGILLVDKPIEWTSHDVVAKVRNILSKEAGRKIKVGHAGTLDPMATGLLLLLVGSYCKKAQDYSKLDKTYEVKLHLGFTSTTGDSEGDLTRVSEDNPSLKEVETVLKSFMGVSQQIPPAYSAIKVGGKRAYKMAREGKEVNIEPRTITIYDISKISYMYPNISFMVSVSSGTYIRSLAEDIGSKLGTGAYLENLARTQVGNFKLKDTVEPADTGPEKITQPHTS